MPLKLWTGGIGAGGANRPPALMQSISLGARKRMTPSVMSALSASHHLCDHPRECRLH